MCVQVDKPKKRRGRPPLVDREKMDPNPPKLTKMMSKLIEVVVNYEDDDGRCALALPPSIFPSQLHVSVLFYRTLRVFFFYRVLSQPFMVLPSKKSFADYYEIIKRPVDFKKIQVFPFPPTFLNLFVLFMFCYNLSCSNESRSIATEVWTT